MNKNTPKYLLNYNDSPQKAETKKQEKVDIIIPVYQPINTLIPLVKNRLPF